LQLTAARRSTAVLQHDRAMHRLSRFAIPYDDGLALVRDADARNLEGVTFACGRNGVLRRASCDIPDLRGVVLDPAGTRIVLRELAVCATDDFAALIEYETCAAGRTLVDRQHGPHATLLNVMSA